MCSNMTHCSPEDLQNSYISISSTTVQETSVQSRKRNASPEAHMEMPRKRRRKSPVSEELIVSSNPLSTRSESSCFTVPTPGDTVQSKKKKASPGPQNKQAKKKRRNSSVTSSDEWMTVPSHPSRIVISTSAMEAPVTEEENKKKNKKKKEKVQRVRPRTRQSIELSLPCISKRRFEDKYLQLDLIGEGGFGSVYAGYRKQDFVPVAIKYVPFNPGEDDELVPLEVSLLLNAAGGPESLGKSAAVSLLDWFYSKTDLVMVMERPAPCMSLSNYLRSKNGYLRESNAKYLFKQLVDAAIDLDKKKIFHRDIKLSNLLVEFGVRMPRVRIIDFGCGCYDQGKAYRSFCGTFVICPPEWIRRKIYKARPTTVWQVGVVLYRMLHYYAFDTSKFLSGELSFRTDLSAECLELLNLCFNTKVTKRVTLQQIQRHPWLN